VLLASPQALAQSQPEYAISVDMLVCADRLYFMPTLQSESTAPYGRTFRFYVTEDATVTPDEANPQRDVAKRDTGFDEWQRYETENDFEPFIDVDWNDWGGTPHLQVWSNGNRDVAIPIPLYTPVAFAGGTGTLSNPYLVSNATQLRAIACLKQTEPSTYYALTNDIDVGGANFIPLGVEGDYFRGGIDGRGYTIDNLTMIYPGSSNIGFLGKTYDFFLRNVRFTNARIHGVGRVGVILGRLAGDKQSTLQNVIVEGAIVRGQEKLGGVAGEAEEFAIIGGHYDVDVIISTPHYHAFATPISFADTERTAREIGGIIGNAPDNVVIHRTTMNVSITQDDHVSSLGEMQKLAGILGRANEEITVRNIDAHVVVDVTIDSARYGGDGSGGLFGEYFEETGVLVDSTAFIDITYRLTAASNGQVIERLGGIVGNPEETAVAGLHLTGSITIDGTNVTSSQNVVVRGIGGAYGYTSGYPVALHDSHIDVDIIILGSHVTAWYIGGLIGDAQDFMGSDLRVGGSVTIDGDAVAVGGLVGRFRNNTPQNVPFNIDSTIYRGAGISVAGTRQDVGVLWGATNGYTPGAGNVFQGSRIYWDSNRNGVTAFDPDELGRPATSAQLGNLTWLTNAGFDPNVWCVTTENGITIPAIIALTPTCQGGGGGGFTPTEPTTPTNLTATPGNASVTLVWNPPRSDGGSETDVYVIQHRPTGSSIWLTLHPYTRCTPDTLTCGIATNLMNGQPYDFRVAAQNAVGRSPWSTTTRATPGTTPNAPMTPTAAPGDTTITLTWIAPTNDGGYPITGYAIEITMGIGGTWTPTTSEPCGPTCATITNLTNGTTYGFRIAATNTLGTGHWSTTTTAQPTRNPTAPTNLTATPGNAQVTLTWQPPTDTSSLTPTYHIDISTDGGSTWTPANATPCNPAVPTCAIIGGLTNGATYAFRITATTTAGTSPAAGPVLATPQAPTDVPVITRVIPGANRGWLIIATPTAATTGHELSLDDGATWQSVTPHVGNRVIRITDLTNATTYRLQLRSIRADDSRSEPTPTTTLMPTGIRVPAPNLTLTIDPNSITTTNDAPTTITLDFLITNDGNTPLTDLWLRWPALPNDVTITNFDTLTQPGTWFTLDDWWYGENVDLAPGATHRVRVTLETQP
jgi:hypothetical protein